jgi:hypothetical protein
MNVDRAHRFHKFFGKEVIIEANSAPQVFPWGWKAKGDKVFESIFSQPIESSHPADRSPYGQPVRLRPLSSESRTPSGSSGNPRSNDSTVASSTPGITPPPASAITWNGHNGGFNNSEDGATPSNNIALASEGRENSYE